jgi:hypothetical protein
MAARKTTPAKAEPKKTKALTPIAMGKDGMQITTLEDAYRFGQYCVASGFAPKGMTKPEQVVMALQTGAELGLPPMRALSCVTVINGRPGLMGEAALALIKSRGVLKRGTSITCDYEGKGEETVCIARAHRKGETKPVEGRFSVFDAKRAGLWKKSGPWSQYPKRMLWWRAVAFLVRDHFSDVILGLTLAEEARDLPPGGNPPARVEVDVTPTDDGPVHDPLLETSPAEEALGDQDADTSRAPLGHEEIEDGEIVGDEEPEPCGEPDNDGEHMCGYDQGHPGTHSWEEEAQASMDL